MKMSTRDNKIAIAEALKTFGRGSLLASATQLFNTLGYSSEKTIELSPNTPENFLNEIDQHNCFRKDKALLSRWKSVDFIFQITGEEINSCASDQLSLQFDAHQKIDNRIIESYLFLAIKLRKGHYTRTDLSTITREINKLFPMPVLILFQHGDTLTFSVINRRLHKREQSKDVLEKVTLIKDIALGSPHRAHIEILSDLSFTNLYVRYRFSNFVALHDAWKKTLDSSELNKRFFREVANWYFWAIQNVIFPKDAGADEEIRNATSVIRLITRLIFVWFIKEKGLLPDDLFNKSKLDDILKYNDAKQSSYYKAILQNLFFATLNQEMNTPKKPDNRQFRNKAKKPSGRDQHYMIHNVYRYESCFKNPDKALELFSTIPFLNGGLFECLDKPDKDNPKIIIRIDGFSDRKDNELVVPDFLLFSEGQEVDLNKSFGTKNKQYKVRGLVNIFDSYKFTINENTPIEEEVALDPELLGKVFENLLAAYNPETGSTARKQTGSFYTPREIVDYMVDESLKASLSNLVAEKIVDCSERDIKTGLDILFTYTEKEHAFNDEEVSKIVETVSELKILDPACGSGAFPMGVLHKLVYILGKLDPDNTLWRDLQKQKAIRETEEAYDMGNKEERHQRIAEIEKTFNFNTSDYGRKLYLIENCIYGVDIQPIAVQIAKLRFFISLVVDQKIDNTQDNRGILPLPNLETNFVAANTLLNVEKPQQGKLSNPEVRPQISQKERELASVRRNHFIARTLKTKRKCRDRDAQLRADISNLLKKEAFLPETTQKLAYWDPYDQNASADFFDPEWMFNISDGFDVVIANPPYVRADSPNSGHADFRKKLEESNEYKTLYEKWDLFIPFIEKGLKLLSENGNLRFITSDALCTSKYAHKLLDLIQEECAMNSIDYFENMEVFEGVGVIPVVIGISKNKSAVKNVSKIIRQEAFENIRQEKRIPLTEFNKLGRDAFRKDYQEVSLDVETERLGDICYISYGLRPNSDERYWKGDFAKDDLICDVRDDIHCKRYIEGKDIDKYVINKIKFLEWNTDRVPHKLVRKTFPELYDRPKILRGRVTGAIYDDSNLVCNDSVMAFVRFIDLACVYNKSIKNSISKFNSLPRRDLEKKSKNYDLKYLLAIINSRFAYHFLNNHRRHRLENYFYPDDLRKLPVPKIAVDDQQPFITLVDQILSLKKSDPQANTSVLEAEIDARVAHLYKLTEEEYSLILSELRPPDPFRITALNCYRDIAKGILK